MTCLHTHPVIECMEGCIAKFGSDNSGYDTA